MDINGVFGDALITSNKEFWETHADKMITATGLLPEFSKLLGESMMVPVKDARVPFFNEFVGRNIEYGAGWKENILAMPETKRYKPKATAEDAFGFYENEGMQAVHTTHFEGWTPQTLPSDLALAEMVNDPGRLGEFVSTIRAQGGISVQMAIDSMIGKKLVSTIQHKKDVIVDDYREYRKGVRDIASTMRTNKGTYVHKGVDTGKYLTAARDVVILMEEITYNDMVSDLSTYPSPDKFVNNARVITIPEMPMPLTTAEFTANAGKDTGVGWDEADTPANLDGDKPLAIIMSADYIEYRPYRGQQRVNVNNNGAGDFTNVHTLYKGSIGIRPWENAVAVYGGAANDDGDGIGDGDGNGDGNGGGDGGE